MKIQYLIKLVQMLLLEEIPHDPIFKERMKVLELLVKNLNWVKGICILRGLLKELGLIDKGGVIVESGWE